MSYGYESDLGMIALALVSLFVWLVIALLIFKAFAPTKSSYYRKYLANLLVAGKIRQLADKEKVNLLEEEKLFLVYNKMNAKRRIENLDKQIEAELMQKIDEDLEKSRDENKKK